MLRLISRPSAVNAGFAAARSFAPCPLCSLRNRRFAPRFVRVFSSASDTNSILQKQQHGNADSSKSSSVRSGLYLVATPIGNLEDITLRAIRILRFADIILSEDTRHSRKLLQYYGIKTPLISYHKFNESERESSILQRLRQGEIIALISDAGTPCISDPGMELVSCPFKDLDWKNRHLR
ncbi:hypothetical protein B296_00015107 [Ensete ventricosum]|uniref:Tetrapyrrole methylase domain-containing protein n=1 Tax=Ensete ventricosum TaxID=4639 RepID=A0A427AH91_ENSVE|nr:hypothetical protein B296_00015107 [Ensete ventricosum]